MSEQTSNPCTTDACESLRARLAKYEDAEGRPVGLTHDQAELVGLVRDLALRAGKHARPLIHAAALGLESQAREIERLKRSAQTNWNEFAEGMKAQSSGVDERAAFEAWRLEKFCGGTERLKKCSNAPDVYFYTAEQDAWKVWQARAALSAPSHGEQGRDLPPFAQKVISKLKRFEECASDSDAGGVDIGRHWLDLLTQLGLLNRVQRSPGLWEISQQGEEVLAAAPSAGSQGGDL